MRHAEETGRRIVDTGRPFGYEEFVEARDRLLEAYPFLGYESIGSSVMGKEIGVIRLGTGPKHVHYNAAMHANEWITGLLLMRFIEDCSAAFRDGKSLRGWNLGSLLAETTLWAAPLINPDGVELVLKGADADHPYARQLIEWNKGSGNFDHWKANIRGVDLNDQFPAHWDRERERRDVNGPGPRDYTGDAPLTEPEAQALAGFTASRDFRLVMAFHTQGKEIYWNYRDYEPKESALIAGRLSRVSGYLPVKLQGSDAGYKDWFIQRFGRPGFTVEAGFGVNPLPLEEFEDMYRETIGIMLEGMEA